MLTCLHLVPKRVSGSEGQEPLVCGKTQCPKRVSGSYATVTAISSSTFTVTVGSAEVPAPL